MAITPLFNAIFVLGP